MDLWIIVTDDGDIIDILKTKEEALDKHKSIISTVGNTWIQEKRFYIKEFKLK